jgi:hypothetical protein
MSDLRLAYSSLSGEFFVGKMAEKDNVLVCRGKKTEVTNDFMDCMISYLYGEYKNNVGSDSIETVITAKSKDGSSKKYKITIKDISEDE